MCATKPSMSWPHSPSRSSRRDWALLGIRSSPRQGLAPGTSSGRFACGVIAIGRVCGTAIGTEPIATTLATPRRSRTSRTARAKASHRVPAPVRAASGTTCRRCRAAAVRRAAARRRTRSDRARTTLPDAGRGSHGSGRRRRWPRSAPPVAVWSTRWRAAWAAAFAASRNPSRTSTRVRSEIAARSRDLVDDVHERSVGTRPVSQTPLTRPRARRRGGRRCRSSRRRPAGRAAAAAARRTTSRQLAGRPRRAPRPRRARRGVWVEALGLTWTIRASHVRRSSRPGAMWVGWAQLTTKPSGRRRRRPARPRRAAGCRPGSRPSVSTVKPTSTGTPAAAAAADDADALLGAGERVRRDQVGARAANASTCARW